MIVLKSVLVAFTLIRISNVATAAVAADDSQNVGLRAIMRVYDECQKSDAGFSPCIKKKAITFIDRVTKIDAINVGDGIKVTRSSSSGNDTGITNEAGVAANSDWEQSLPRGLVARDEALSNILLDKVAHLLSGRTIKVTLPEVSSDEIGRGVEEGRGKMKKMMGMMMMGFAMKMAAMIPVAIAGLYLLAGKALIISKIALLLAGIIGIKKLLSSKQSSGGHTSSGWQSSGSGGGGGGWQNSGGGSGGGWDRRSNDEAQHLAYKGYISQ